MQPLWKETQPAFFAEATQYPLTETTIHVANTILQQEATLLPTVYDFFSATLSECVATAHLTGEREVVTARWILSNLVVCLGSHLRYTCKIRKYGTLLYRNNGEKALTLALYKAKPSNPEGCSSMEQPERQDGNNKILRPC